MSPSIAAAEQQQPPPLLEQGPPKTRIFVVGLGSASCPPPSAPVRVSADPSSFELVVGIGGRISSGRLGLRGNRGQLEKSASADRAPPSRRAPAFARCCSSSTPPSLQPSSRRSSRQMSRPSSTRSSPAARSVTSPITGCVRPQAARGARSAKARTRLTRLPSVPLSPLPFAFAPSFAPPLRSSPSLLLFLPPAGRPDRLLRHAQGRRCVSRP